jgi:hypothetical protein
MNSLDTIKAIQNAVVAAILLAVLAIATYMAFEPVVSRSQSATDTFLVQQTITGEISFKIVTGDVTMNGSVNGLTGGYATGTTHAVVQTNDPDGYTMTLKFPFATTSGMQANTASTFINNYTPATPGTPDFTWVDNAPSGASEFGYSVSASTTADLAQEFKDNGTVCGGAGSADNIAKCWMNPSTTAQTIVNRSSGSAATGATTTIRFKVAVPSNPLPALDDDIYTATATLTATVN